MKKHYLPALLWLLFLTGLSLTPNMTLPHFNLFSTDKLGHFAAYALLAWFMSYGMEKSGGKPLNQTERWVVFGLATAYGALLECVQGAFIPGRIFGLDDMIANGAGACLIFLKRFF